MKEKDLKEIRLKDIKEVEKLVVKKKSDLMDLVIKSKGSGEKNVKKAKNIRKDIAQILTIIREKELLDKEKAEGTERSRSNEGPERASRVEGKKLKKITKSKERKLNK